MAIETFDNLYEETERFLREGRYQEALDLLNTEGERFPENAQIVLYLRSCMAARLERPELALDYLRQAVDNGFWYSDYMMRNSPSWQPLQGVPAFEELAAVCKARQDEAAAEPQLLTLEPEGAARGKPLPLLMALHGNGQTARTALDGWHDVVAQGWLLAAPQSSMIAMKDTYLWDDQEMALREIAAHYEELSSRYDIDRERVIIAGFSMGGETALRVALLGTIPARGFILLGPGGPTMDEPDGWLPLIEEAEGRGLRGYIFVGEDDPTIPHDAIRTLVTELNRRGIACEIQSFPGLRHDYPLDFGAHIARALQFVERA